MSMTNINDFPYFLQSYEDLADHLRSQLDRHHLSSTEKGKAFAEFVRLIIPMTEIGLRYQFDSENIHLGKLSHDGGVDILCESADGSHVLYVQSKLRLDEAIDFDSIISKFKNYVEKHSPLQDLWQLIEEENKHDHNALSRHFMIVTLSKLTNIQNNYEKSGLASKAFYQKIKKDAQLSILDGPRLLPLLQSCYRRMHILPSNIDICFDCPPIQKGSVYIGIISAVELKKCYDEFGDALFLENVRGFLGSSSGKKNESRENVNAAILDTAKDEPDQMLAKNNGITFRAKKVSKLEGDVLRLEEASIVNGCQTTMCLVQSPSAEAFVLVKIVEAPEAWNIAKSANFQNKVEQVKLLLAQYIRLPLVEEIAMKQGTRVTHDYAKSVFDVFTSFYRNEVAYDEIEYLFTGLFSRNPNNVINANYTDLRTDMMNALLRKDTMKEEVFNTLFDLYKAVNEATDQLEKEDSEENLFQRFWSENKPHYRCFLALLTSCAILNMNLYDEKTQIEDYSKFISSLRSTLLNEKERFINYYKDAFTAVTSNITDATKSDKENQQSMHTTLKRSKFKTLFILTRMTANRREKRPSSE